MSIIIRQDTCVYAMDPNNKPAQSVSDGATMVFMTKDCFSDQIKTMDTPYESLDWTHINPATGPVFIENAKPGDILKVDILDIQISDQCAMITGKNVGVCGDFFDKTHVRVMPIKDGAVQFSDKIQIPLRPMIGVIGVSPASEAINCGTPGEHGGNMDCKEITAGTTLYLPVNVDGALLAMGDLHGVMGDGEVSGCGAEVCGQVTVKVTVMKDAKMPTPFISKEGYFMAIASALTTDEALQAAALKGVDFLMCQINMTRDEAVAFLSLAADLKICQVVDPLKTARIEMPKKLLSGYTQLNTI